MTDLANPLPHLLKEKERLALERDLTAEFYNLIMTKAKGCDKDPEMYTKYMEILMSMEFFSEKTKEEMRVVNRQVCEIIGAESIVDTEYDRACEWRYGFGKPNAE